MLIIGLFVGCGFTRADRDAIVDANATILAHVEVRGTIDGRDIGE